MEAIVWSQRQDELAWLAVHNAALRKLGGVPGVIRVDNTKTAIAQGAGPWGVVNERYATYARTLSLPRRRDAAARAAGEGQSRATDPGAQDGLRSAPARVAGSRGAADGDRRGGAPECGAPDLSGDGAFRVGDL